MTKLERFYEWVSGRIDGQRQVGMAKAILETPRSEMADFELALAAFTIFDNPDILQECLQIGGLEHWRRVRIRARWEQLCEEMYAIAPDSYQNLATAMRNGIDAASDRIENRESVRT